MCGVPPNSTGRFSHVPDEVVAATAWVVEMERSIAEDAADQFDQRDSFRRIVHCGIEPCMGFIHVE